MNSMRSKRCLSVTLFVIAVLGSFTGLAYAADANLNVQFTTTDCGGTYAPRHVHVVWIKDSTGNFVATIGTTTTDNKRAVWANSQASRLIEWYSSNSQANTDIAARTGATTSTFQTYSFDWNWRNTDGTIVPDGDYQIHFLQTSSNSGTPNNKTSFNITKGSTAWSTGPVSQGGYNNVSLSFTPAGLGIDATDATNVASWSATLNGVVTGTDGVDPQVYIYWGQTDGGTVSTSWENEVDLGILGVGSFSTDVVNLTSVTTYYYRCRVVTTSPAKDIWTDSAVSFTTPTPDVAQINIVPEQLYFNQVELGTSHDSTITLQNLGELSLQINSFEFIGLESDVYMLVSPPTLPLVLNAYQPPAPADWISQDIGAVAVAGSVEFDESTITVQGSGADIWGEYDEFHFVYQTLTGDGQIIARVDSVENTNEWAKAGVMMRNSLGSNEVKNVYMAMTPGNGPTFQWRSYEDTYSSHPYSYTAPYWVKLVRSGNTFSGYHSPDGVTWTQEGSNQTISMNSTIYVGLAVTSHNDGSLCTAVFSNVDGDIQMPSDEVIDEEILTVRFSPKSVQDYKYVKLAISSNDPDKVAYVELEGAGGPDAALGTRQVGGVGGTAKALAKYGDNILLGQGAMLVLLDVSNPTSPSRVNQIRLDGVIEAITVQGDVAYAALGNKGFSVVDLTNFMPLEGAMTIETGGFASDIDSEGSFLCIADGIVGTHVYDISTPLNPSLMSTYETTGAASSVEVSSGLLYTLDESEGIKKIQLSPSSVLGSYSGLEFGTGIKINGTTAYAVDSFGNLSVLDVTADPNLLSETILQVGSAMDAEVQSGYIYVIGQTGLEVLSTSNPTSSTSVFVDPNFTGEDVMIDGTVAYVAAGLGGLDVLDISNPAAISLLGSYSMLAASSGVASDSLNDVYVVGNGQNLMSYDVSTSAQPVVNEVFGNLDQAEDVVVEGQYVYVAAGLAGLKVFDLLNPAGTPGTFATNGFASAISVNGSKAVVCDSNDVYVLNVSSPMSPSLIGSLSAAGWASDVAAGSTHGYIAEGGMGISILNLSTAQFVGSYPVAGLAYGVAIDSEVLYVACGTAGVTVLDVSNPVNPSLITEYDLPGMIVDIAKVGDKLCVADATYGVSILDVSNPAAPSLYASAATSSPAFHVSIAGSRILVADKKGGLGVLGVTDWPKGMLLANISGDNIVDIDDLNILTEQWLNMEVELNHIVGNINYYDTTVNLRDLSVLGYNWLADESLQLHLQLDETGGDTADDSSIYDRSGLLVNGPVWSSGVIGGALDFDGADDYIKINSYKGIPGMTSRTCAFWIKTTNTRVDILGWGRLLDDNQQYVTGQKYQVVFYNEEVGVLVQGGNAFCAAPEVNDDQWHHVAVVLDDANDDGILNINEAQFYIDGSARAFSRTAPLEVNTNAYNDVHVGMYPEGNTYWLDGSLDDIRVYDCALSGLEIAELAQ